MGFENWERCTNHGSRRLGITTAMSNADTVIAPVVLGTSRHKNFNTSLTYQKTTNKMRHSYDNAIHGKHVKSPSRSPTQRKMARFEEDSKPPALVVTSNKKQEDENKQCQDSTPMFHDTDSITTNPTNAGALTTYISTEHPPLVTPANILPTKTIVNQHKLSNIQRNIFVQPSNAQSHLSHHTHPGIDSSLSTVSLDTHKSTSELSQIHSELQQRKIDDEKKELVQQIELLKQQLATTKEKHEEVLSSYKEKYEDVKQDLREARQDAKLLDMQLAAINSKQQQQCTIL
jgi:hypothetical protein